MALLRTRRFIGAGTLAATAALLLAGCGGSGSTDEASASAAAPSAPESAVASAAPSAEASASEAPQASGELTIWTDDYEPTFAPVVKEWADKNGLTVKWVQKDFATMGDQFVAAVPAGEGPDLFITPTTTNKFVSNGVVAPVQLPDDGAGLQSLARAAVTQDGQIWGVPFTVENIALFRNTELVPEAPTTWDEMISTGQALVDEGKANAPFGVGQDPKAGNPYLLMPLQTSFGSYLFAQDANGNFDGNQLVIGDEAGQAFAKWLSEAGKSGTLNPDMTIDIALKDFMDGKLPYLITGPWDLNLFKKDGTPYAISAIPSAGGETVAPFVGHYGAYMSSQSKNPLAASLFLTDFMYNTDYMVKIWENRQNPPALLSAAEIVASDPDMMALAEVGKTGTPIPPIPEMDQVWGPWGETEVLIQRGQGGDPVQLWTDMAAKIQAAIDKN